ncbi:MAG TPA: hypothetical protein VI386_29720, partial [Candidatus Sulfotelmatobacter sp.]
KLLSIDGSKSRFSRHAVVAHIRSLPTLANFAMTLLDRATISSQLPVPHLPNLEWKTRTLKLFTQAA